MKIKKLHEDTQLPTRGSEEAAGWDLYLYDAQRPAAGGMWAIEPGDTLKCKTGFAMALDKAAAALILPRSGLATKKGLRPANTPGLIDSDYRGEVIVALHNDSHDTQFISKGERIAQMVIVPYLTNSFELAEELDETARGAGGFGSTGTN